jgi:hypothetical protein
VSASKRETVREYITRQDEHHLDENVIQDEYLELLQRSGVASGG